MKKKIMFVMVLMLMLLYPVGAMTIEPPIDKEIQYSFCVDENFDFDSRSVCYECPAGSRYYRNTCIPVDYYEDDPEDYVTRCERGFMNNPPERCYIDPILTHIVDTKPEPNPIQPCYNANGDYKHCKNPELDIVFVIDATGSMADEIRSVKYHIKNIVKKVQSGNPQPKVRVGVVHYRDYPKEEDEYVSKSLGLTTDVDEALQFIESIVANGGGDTPEAVEAGLNDAVRMRWKDSARKMIFLIGDAPPHGVGSNDYLYTNGPPVNYDYQDMITKANAKDIRIFTISGSGMDFAGKKVWLHLAEETGGSSTHLRYKRVAVQQYFEDEEIEGEYLQEARASVDYDAQDDSIMVNSLADVAQKAIVSQAQEVGVVYENTLYEDTFWDDSDIDYPSDEIKDDTSLYSDTLYDDSFYVDIFKEDLVFIDDSEIPLKDDPVKNDPVFIETSPQKSSWDRLFDWIVFWD